MNFIFAIYSTTNDCHDLDYNLKAIQIRKQRKSKILDLFLKTKEVDQEILTIIDNAIPLPIIFQIHFT